MSDGGGGFDYDVFVSHASEDKAELVEPLVGALEDRGLRVWYDRHAIQLGDDFRRKMDEGLARSRFGVVVLSPSFRKYWPEAELSALFNQEGVLAEKRILPVIHGLTAEEVTRSWPLLAARAPAWSTEGADAVADRIAAAVRAAGPYARRRGLSRIYGRPPTPSVQFVGRDAEMEQLEALLDRGTAVRVAAAIEGLAGVGKTELAVQFAHRVAQKGRYPGGIYWLDAENPDLTRAWGGAIADGLGVPEGPLANRTSQVIRNVSRRDVPLLLVLDYADSWSQVHRPSPLPTGPHVHYLVTTRTRRLGGAGFRHLSLGFLQTPFDRQLLLSIAGRGPESLPGEDELLTHLGGYALALELAGAFLAEYPEETPASYLRALRSQRDVEGEVRELTRYSHTVSQALHTVWNRLDQNVRQAWLLAACFEPEFATPALADAVGLPSADRRALRRLHLIESAAGGIWRMHRVTREFGRRIGLAKEVAAARKMFASGCCKFMASADLISSYRYYLPDRAHLDATLQLEELTSSEDSSEYCLYLDRIGIARHSAGELGAARELLETSLDLSVRRFGDDHPAVATHRSNLAGVLQDLGQPKAAKRLLQQALASFLRVDHHHPHVATCRSKLAGALKALGDLAGAKEHLQAALESHLRHFGEDDVNVATNRSDLALVLRALGDLPAARQLLQEALDGYLRQLGEGHPHVATCRSNLAVVLHDLGDHAAARELLARAIESDLQNFGEEHPSVATHRANLAVVLKELGDLTAAKELLEQALESDLNLRGEDHPSTARHRSNLGSVVQKLGDLTAARKLLAQAVESDLRNFGENHPTVATNRCKLAAVLHDLGDPLAAKELLEKALESNRRNFGDNHPEVARCHTYLALVLTQLGKLVQSKAEARLALAAVVDQPEGSLIRREVERLAGGVA